MEGREGAVASIDHKLHGGHAYTHFVKPSFHAKASKRTSKYGRSTLGCLYELRSCASAEKHQSIFGDDTEEHNSTVDQLRSSNG